MLDKESDVLAAAIGRLLIGGFFAVSGANNLVNIGEAIDRAVSVGIPLAIIIVPLIAFIKVILGTMIVLKFHTKLSSLVLVFYVLFVSLVFYNPTSWDTNPTSEIVFWRNTAVLGGLFCLYAYSRGISQLRSNEPRRMGKHVTKEEWEKLKQQKTAV